MRTKDLWLPEKKARPASVTSGSSITVDEGDKHWFASSNKCDLQDLQKLLQKDGDLLNKKDYFTGYAAIHWAAKYGREDMIHWLVEQKADINIRTNGGYSPLHIATQHKQETIVHTLVNEYQADIDIRDYSGRKAMHYGVSDVSPIIEDMAKKEYSGVVMRASRASRASRTSRTAPIMNRPLSLVRSVSMSQLSSLLFEDRKKSTTEDEVYKKKKRGISLTSSFMNKGKKRFIPKKISRGNSFSEGNATPKLNKSPSLPDLYGNPFEYPDRRESLILNGFDSHSQLINGYATFINKNKYINTNKYHRRTSTCPMATSNEQLASISCSKNVIDEHKMWGKAGNFAMKDKHTEWRASTYV